MKFINFLNFFAIVLGILLLGSGRNGNWDEILFFSFSAYLNPVWMEKNAKMNFFNFSNFFGTFYPPSGRNRIRDENCFRCSSAYLNPDWIEIMPEWSFLIFWIFLLLFWEFSCSGRVGTKFWLNFFFFHFLALSEPCLDTKEC